MPHRPAAAQRTSREMIALKRGLRERALADRAAIAEGPPRDAAARAKRRIGELLPAEDLVVAGFWSMGSEIDCRSILDAIHAAGYRCCLPVVAKPRAPLMFRRWEPEMTLIPGAYGEKIPPPEIPEVAPDVLLVPGLLFDRRGFRLGYGAGYYDRTLAALRASKSITAIGLAYAGQLADDVPHDGSDEPLDWIVTEAETIGCATLRGELRAYS
jgi:5-formyltetrahydrofolate cyclo-ligase